MGEQKTVWKLYIGGNQWRRIRYSGEIGWPTATKKSPAAWEYESTTAAVMILDVGSDKELRST